MAETDIPNPSSTIIYFMLITLCFIFFTIFNINQTKEIIKTAIALDNKIINIVYIFFLVIGSYFINIYISKALCSHSIQWGYISLITFLPWIIIFVSLYFILKIFPGWISPFSNTIGYIIIGLLGVEKTYENIFKTGNEVSGNQELVKAIANMNSNRTKFVNQISTNVDDFNNFLVNMKDAIKIDDPDYEKHKLKLYQLLIIKQFVGKIVWYILAGILISSISYNLLISMACEKSLEEIQKDFETSKEKTAQAGAAQAGAGQVSAV